MKNFLCGVANVYAMDANDNLLFVSKTLLDSSLTVSTKMTEIRSGQGDKLAFQYFYGSDLKLTLTEAQFSLSMLSSSLGTSLVTGTPIWATETVTLGVAGAGVLVGIPIATTSGAILGWVSDSSNTQLGRVTFTGQNFTLPGGVTGQVVTVRYYENMASAQSMTINSNIIPSVVHLVLEAQLFSGDTTNSSPLIGKILIDIGKFQLDGNLKLDLKSSGVSNTPLAGSALDNNGVYATITQSINSANWYDGVTAIVITPSTPTLSLAGVKTSQLLVYAVPAVGSAFLVPANSVGFVSSVPADATVTASGGLVTGIIIGTSQITATVTAKPTLISYADVTVTA